jgi:hypothetical protein
VLPPTRLEPSDGRLRGTDSLRDLGLRQPCARACAQYLVEEPKFLVEVVIGFADAGAPKRTTTESSET